jgi:hypothetical protein
MSVLTELLKTFRENTPVEYSASTPKIFDFFDHGPAIIVTKDQKEILAILYQQLQKINDPDEEYIENELEEGKVLKPADDSAMRKEVRERVFMAYLQACVFSGFMGDQVIILEKVIHDFTIKTQDSLLMKNAELVSIHGNDDMQAASEIIRLAGKGDDALARKSVKYIFSQAQKAIAEKDINIFTNCMNVLPCLGDMCLKHWNSLIFEEFHLGRKRNRVISDNYLIQPSKNAVMLAFTEKEIGTRFDNLIKAVKAEEVAAPGTPRRASGL